jgi:DoxX-like protein
LQEITFAKEGAMLNRTRIFYWTTTTLIALETLVGGFADLTHGRTLLVSGPFVVDVLAGLGYPAYVLWIIGIWKILGAIILVVPGFLRLKEWAYAGIVFELSGAAASLAACGRRTDLIAPLFLLGLALASWALRPANRTLGTLFIAQQ